MRRSYKYLYHAAPIPLAAPVMSAVSVIAVLSPGPAASTLPARGFVQRP